ncbi:MAG: HAD family hydrolase [Candidatus Uhrbacteria bacterium]
MKYKAIFFDADGVLVKNKHLFSEQLQKDFGIKKEVMTPFFTVVFGQCSLGKADLKEELAKIIDDWGWKGAVEELLDYWFSVGTEIEHDIVEYIKTLRDQEIRCFMTTDQEKYRGEHLRDTLGGGKVFEDVFFSAEIGNPKKTESFWEEVFVRINTASHDPSSEIISRDQTLFVDDDEVNTKAVSDLGINVLLYRKLDDLRQELSE